MRWGAGIGRDAESMTLHFIFYGLTRQHASLTSDEYATYPTCHSSREFKRYGPELQGLKVGIGLGLARRLLRNDPQLTVIATSRTVKQTREAILKDQDGVEERLKVLQLDVTNEESIEAAKEQVEKEFGRGGLKCLFNISGIVNHANCFG